MGISLLDNPYLLEGANSEQAKALDPTQTEAKMSKLHEQETALTKVMARLPLNEELYVNMLSELKVVARERDEVEKDFLEFKLKENPDFVLQENEQEKRRKRIKEGLSKALETEKKGETKLVYKPIDGFLLYMDYVINIPRFFERVYVTYRLVDDSQEKYDEVKTSVKALEANNVNTFKMAFAEKHQFFRVQASESAYILFKFYVEDTFITYDQHEFDDVLNIDEETDEVKGILEEKRFVVYGWSPFKLFHRNKLINGRWKLPLYKTPCPTEFSFALLKGAIPLKWGNIFMRIDMKHEFYEENNILMASDLIRAYEVPGYLQENFNHPEIDEIEEDKRKAALDRRNRREAAIQRKRLLIQLMERENRIRQQIKEEEEDIRKKKLDDLLKQKEDEIDELKKKLEDAQRELEAEIRKLIEEKQKNELKKDIRRDNMAKVVEEKFRTGIRVKLEGLSGFRSKFQIKVVYGLFIDSEVIYDDLGEMMVYETQKYNKDGKNSENEQGPKINIKFENESKEFVKNIQGLIYLNKSRNREVMLGFQVILIKNKKEKELEDVKDIDEDDPLKDLPLPEPEELLLLGWRFWSVASTGTSIKAEKSKNKKGKPQTLLMYQPPLLTPPFKTKYIEETKTKLTFTFDTFTYDMDSLNYFAEQRLQKKVANKDAFEKIKQIKYDKFFKEAFIKNSDPQYKDQMFNKGSGIDVYIDGCRFLPDNATVTKIIVRFLNSELTDVVSFQGGRPELDSDIYNPIFNFRQELRAPNFDPTLMMYITFITFDERGRIKQPSILGYSMFNLFINRKTKQQPLDRGEFEDTILQDGCYQIPIYCQPFVKENPFYVKTCEKYDKLPASSVLIRIHKSPISEDGLKNLSINTPGFEDKKKKEEYGIWRLPPKYSTGAYNSAMCGARQSEIELAELRKKRPAVESRGEVLNKLKPIYQSVVANKTDKSFTGVVPDLGSLKRLASIQENIDKLRADSQQKIDSMKDIPEVDQKASPSGSQRSLMKSKTKLEEALEEREEEEVYLILDTLFAYKPTLPFLNLKFFSKYREDAGGGFKFIIDGLHNLPDRGFYMTSYALNPPGEYHVSGKTEGIRINTNFDWDRSTAKTLFYNEGYVKFSRIPFDTNLHFIVEISSVDLPAFKEPTVTPKAWTILPIFVIDEFSKQGYVNSNVYVLPLFEGKIKPELAQELQGSDPWAKIESLVSSKKIKYYGSSSVYCRLLDFQREGHFQQAFDYKRASDEYLPSGKLSRYLFTESDQRAIPKAKKLWEYINYEEDRFAFNKRLSEVCFAKYNIANPT